MAGDRQLPQLRQIHRALADPLRIRLFEHLAVQPRSARELADLVGVRAERLYHHLAQLETAGLIRIAEYRPLAGGKVERVYAPAAAEAPGDDASSAEVALLLNAALETTRADINAAAAAKEAGEDRRITLTRSGVRLNRQHMAELTTAIEELIRAAQDHPDDDGVWTTVVWTAVDRQDRSATPASPRGGAPGGQPDTHEGT